MLLQTGILILHVFIAVALIGLVMLQRGKGAEAGAAFGAGASGTVFGAQGSANFLSRATAVLATLFFATSLTLAYFSSQVREPESVLDRQAPAENAIESPIATDELEALPGRDESGPGDAEIPVIETPEEEVVIEEDEDAA